MIVEKLRQFGLSEKEISVYLALISLGSSPVKVISKQSGINRGTVYDILHSLMQAELVATFHQQHKDGKKQYFVAEPPEKIIHALEKRTKDLANLKASFQESLPELKALYEKSGSKPVIKYFEGDSGVRIILQDLLGTVGHLTQKEYCVYSAADVRNSLYKVYPNFNKDRLKAKIKVRVIALGKGGEFAGLDERKWMSKDHGAPAYVLIYGNKVAMISLAQDKEPVGVVIEDQSLYETQKMIFEFNWSKL